MLSAGATIAQMVFLSKIIDWGFLAEGLQQMEPLLLLLLGAATLRSGFCWSRGLDCLGEWMTRKLYRSSRCS